MVRADAPAHDSRMAMKLLIVDDSELILGSLLHLLDGVAGIDSIATASTLAQARESAARIQPTLIVLDLSLPDGHGHSVIAPLKGLVGGVKIAVLSNDVSLKFFPQKAEFSL
jgi:DNA-binding NarL/FixJ family response regulator